MRVGQHLASDGGIEGAAFGVGDPRVEVERGALGAAGVVDAIGCGERIDVVVIEVEIAGEGAELLGLGNAREWDLREVTFASSSAESIMLLARPRRKIAGPGAGRALADEDAYAERLAAGFLQGLDLAQANHGGEFRAVANDAFGGRGAALHGALAPRRRQSL